MNKQQKWFVLFALIVVGAIGTRAQLQQSGGSGSSTTATQSGTWTVQPGNTANTTPWLMTLNQGGNSATVTASNALKVDGSAVTQPVSGTFWQATQPVSGTVSVNALPAGTNVIGVVNTIPKTACGNTVASQALAAVPTSATAVFSATTCITTLVVNNTNGSPATVTVSDNQGTPVNDTLTFSIPANSQLIQPLGGVAFTSGVKWTASGTGLTGAVLGYQ